MSVYKLTAGVVGLLLAAVVVTAVVGVATVFAAPAAIQESRPDNSPSSWGCAQEPWPYGCQWRAQPVKRISISWSAAGLKHRLEKRCPFSYLISVLVWWNVPSGPALSCVSLMGLLEWARGFRLDHPRKLCGPRRLWPTGRGPLLIPQGEAAVIRTFGNWNYPTLGRRRRIRAAARNPTQVLTDGRWAARFPDHREHIGICARGARTQTHPSRPSGRICFGRNAGA